MLVWQNYLPTHSTWWIFTYLLLKFKGFKEDSPKCEKNVLNHIVWILPDMQQ